MKGYKDERSQSLLYCMLLAPLANQRLVTAVALAHMRQAPRVPDRTLRLTAASRITLLELISVSLKL